VGVQHKINNALNNLLAVSIPILRVGVQHAVEAQFQVIDGFNSHTARGSSTILPSALTVSMWRFNSHTARGSSTRRHSTTTYSDSKFQFPYCAWEFNRWYAFMLYVISFVSIPILRVGVQLKGSGMFTFAKARFNSHTARGSSTALISKKIKQWMVSIPILRVGVQRDILTTI